MSLQITTKYDGQYTPSFTFTYSADGIRCSAEYSDVTQVDAADWRRFANNLGLIITDQLDFCDDNGGSDITFDGAEVTFHTSNYLGGTVGVTQFSIARDRCLEPFQRIVDILDAWEANVDL
jgi:hypothetical protein